MVVTKIAKWSERNGNLPVTTLENRGPSFMVVCFGAFASSGWDIKQKMLRPFANHLLTSCSVGQYVLVPSMECITFNPIKDMNDRFTLG